MISLAEANYAAGDFGRNLADEVKTKANVRVVMDTSTKNTVAGVFLPKFALIGEKKESGDEKAMLGLTQGGGAISKCREAFSTLLKTLMEIASLQAQYVSLSLIHI